MQKIVLFLPWPLQSRHPVLSVTKQSPNTAKAEPRRRAACPRRWDCVLFPSRWAGSRKVQPIFHWWRFGQDHPMETVTVPFRKAEIRRFCLSFESPENKMKKVWLISTNYFGDLQHCLDSSFELDCVWPICLAELEWKLTLAGKVTN